jgi:hypothetical protein
MFLICSQSQHEDIERGEKFPSVFEGHLVSANRSELFHLFLKSVTDLPEGDDSVV